MSGERPVVLLAAHGERGGAGNNARLAALVAEVAGLMPDADVGSVLVSVDGLVEKTLAACGTRRNRSSQAATAAGDLSPKARQASIVFKGLDRSGPE